MSGGGDEETTNTTQPWEAIAPHTALAYDQFFNQFSQPGPAYFPGETVAAQAPQTEEAVGAATDLARQQLGTINPALTGAMTRSLDPNNVFSSPALSSAIDAAVRPVFQNFEQRVLPAIQQEASASGGYGGSRQGVAEGIAGQEALAQAGDISSTMSNQAYQLAVDNAVRTMLGSPAVIGAQQAGLTPLYGAGDVTQGYNQQLINADMARWNYEQMLPYQMAQDLLSGMTGTPYLSTVSSGPTSNQSPLLGALGGGLGAAGAAGGLGMTTASPWLLPIIGAGAMMGGLASR